jgi:hypothetical protein
VLSKSGLREAVTWRGKDSIAGSDQPVRVRVNFIGARPDIAKLFAIYVQ